MKGLIIVLALLGLTVAQRQPAKDVIIKFREVAPKYMEILQTGETNLGKVQTEARGMMAKFHEDIITIKESFVVTAIKKESQMHTQITAQAATVDRTCLRFLNTTLDMGMDLAGAGYTNCINNADEAFNGIVAEYLNATELQETALNELRLLDVFRGDNVFYSDSPQNIIDKLNRKLSELKINPESLGTNLEAIKETLKKDLDTIRSKYAGCMTQAERLLNDGVNVMMAQLTFSCLGSVIG